MSLFDRSNMRPKKNKSSDQLIISAPLGDVRHVSHIGRDGADFGEEHLFQNQKSRNNSLNQQRGNGRTSYVSQHDSPIIKSAIPIHQAANVVKLDNKTESHDSGNYTCDQNLIETSNIDTLESIPDNQILNIMNNNNINNNNSNHINLNKSGSINSSKSNRDSRHSHKSNKEQRRNSSKRNKNHQISGDSSSKNNTNTINTSSNNSDRIYDDRFYSKNSLESLSDTAGSYNGVAGESEGDSTSLLGDVLAVMELDKFRDLPGVTSRKKVDLTGSLEELNSSQFTMKSDDNLNQNEILNLEVISETSREFDMGDLQLSNNTSSIEHTSNDSLRRRLGEKMILEKVNSIDSNYSPTHSTPVIKQSLSAQNSYNSRGSNSAIRSIAVRNQSFQSSQRQQILIKQNSREQNMANLSMNHNNINKLPPLKVGNSDSELSTDEIAL